MPNNLIVSSIGDHSCHRAWLGGPEKPDFDLLLIYYGNGPDTAAADADYYIRKKGFKFEHLHFILQHHAEILHKYERIWCPDNDLVCDTKNVNIMFDIFAQYRLQLAQPAIAEGEFSYKALLQQRGKLLRYTPYVEVMCPLFTHEAFFKVAALFPENRSGWGIDWVWSKWFSPREMAIIDKVGVKHVGPLGQGELYEKLAKSGVSPFREFSDVVARHGGIKWEVHRRMLSGKQRMDFVPDPGDDRSLFQRARDHVRWRLSKPTDIPQHPSDNISLAR